MKKQLAEHIFNLVKHGHWVAVKDNDGYWKMFIYLRPDQIIQPYEYGHTEAKKTALWLKNLPKLKPTKIVEPEYTTFKSGKRMAKWYSDAIKLPKEERTKLRSKTFQGIADAIADQWI